MNKVGAALTAVSLVFSAIAATAADQSHIGRKEETRAVLPLLKDGCIFEELGLTHGIFDVGAPVLGKHLRAFLAADL